MRTVENFSEQAMLQKSLDMLEGALSDEEVKSFLEELHEKGETADEIVGLVKALRQKAVTFPEVSGTLADICGTGGDRSFSFNISTITSVVLAGLGITVAKHGNRSVSSKTGSTDVLEQLGVSFETRPEQLPLLLESSGLAFVHAPAVHPALGALRNIRKEIGTPTIFNLAGPLANPLPIAFQMTGVYAKELMEPMADALIRLGRRRGAVVFGAGGLDELTLAGTNELVVFDENGKQRMTLHPEEVGLASAPVEAIRGGEPERNADIFREVLAGKEGAYLDTIVFNAGAFLFITGSVSTVAEGVKLARESILSGQTAKALEAHRLAAGVYA